MDSSSHHCNSSLSIRYVIMRLLLITFFGYLEYTAFFNVVFVKPELKRLKIDQQTASVDMKIQT